VLTNFFITLIIFYAVFLVIWLYTDAERRGRSGLLVAALYVALGPIFLLFWWWARRWGKKTGKS
jgi:hypothetical protein